MADLAIEGIDVLSFCFATLVLLIWKRKSWHRIPHYRYPLISFFAFFVGSLTAPFNLTEHISYLVSCIALLVWCYKLLKEER